MFEANAGYKREFSLTNIDGEVFEEELSWGVESQIHVQPQHVAEATLMVDERRQTGSFVVETRMRGTVYVSFTSPRDNNAQVDALLLLLYVPSSISQLPNLFRGTPIICNCILLLIVSLRSFSKLLPSVTFAEEKVLIFLILREKC